MEILAGIDITETARFSKIVQKHQNRFLKKIFTARELKTVPPGDNHIHYLCISFSFKEAIWKALPEKLQAACYFKDIEILWQKGVPSAALKGNKTKYNLIMHFFTSGGAVITTAFFLKKNH